MNPAARRVRILLGVLLLLHVAVLVRIFGMQIVQADVWKSKADLQHYQTRRLMPRRGALLDRAGRFLATQEPGFHVELDLLRLESRTWRCTRCLRSVARPPETCPRRCGWRFGTIN